MALQRTSSFSSDGFSDASSLEIVSRHVFELDMRLRRVQPAVDELAATLAAQILSHDATRRRLLDLEERLPCMQARLQAQQAQLRLQFALLGLSCASFTAFLFFFRRG